MNILTEFIREPPHCLRQFPLLRKEGRKVVIARSDMVTTWQSHFTWQSGLALTPTISLNSVGASPNSHLALSGLVITRQTDVRLVERGEFKECESGFNLTAFINELPPMAGSIPLKAGHSVSLLFIKEGGKNSPLLRGVDSIPKGMRRRGVSKIILNARPVSIENSLSLHFKRILINTWQSGLVIPRRTSVGLAASQLGCCLQ